VRCRIRVDAVTVEVQIADRELVTDDVLGDVSAAMARIQPGVRPAILDDQPYRPGRALEIVS
jgi:uncharacterized protein